MPKSYRWVVVLAMIGGLAAGCGGGGGKAALETSTSAPAGSEVPAPDAATAATPSGPLGARPSTPATPASPKQGKPGTGKPVPGQYIVTLNPGENPRSVAAIAKVDPIAVYESALNGFAAKLNAGQLNALRQNKAVKAIEQDQFVELSAWVTQQIGSTGQPWGIDRVDQPSALSRTYTYWSNAGAGVTAYIIDSGIATAHPDFGGRAINVADFVGDGRNGQDCNGHGTHVAGTVGGTRFGIAKRVELRGVRVLDCLGNGAGSSILSAIDWVRKNAVKPAVANISLGSDYSAALNTATTNLINSGVFVAVAAGNEDTDACSRSPASALGTLTVAASDWFDTRANLSNTGSYPWGSNYGPCVDVYAPGVNVQSAWLSGLTNTIGGTSMASPHVAGVAALLKADYGDQTSAQIYTWIVYAAKANVIKSNITGTPNKLLYMYGW